MVEFSTFMTVDYREIKMKKGDLVEYINPLQDEIGLKFILLEEPDGGRVLAEALVDMVIRPSYVLGIDDIRIISKNDSIELAE